jgi:flagellar motor switch protein FliG
MQLNDQSIQQCLKEISTVDLARALKGIEGKAQIKVFKNLPKRSAAILQETVEHLDLMRESEMIGSKHWHPIRSHRRIGSAFKRFGF